MARVQSLVRELRSHMPCGVAKTITKKKTFFFPNKVHNPKSLKSYLEPPCKGGHTFFVPSLSRHLDVPPRVHSPRPLSSQGEWGGGGGRELSPSPLPHPWGAPMMDPTLHRREPLLREVPAQDRTVREWASWDSEMGLPQKAFFNPSAPGVKLLTSRCWGTLSLVSHAGDRSSCLWFFS